MARTQINLTSCHINLFWLDIGHSKKESKNKVSFAWAGKEFIWPRQKIVLIGLSLIISKSLAGLVLPYVTKNLTDDIIPPKDMNTLSVLLVIVVISIII